MKAKIQLLAAAFMLFIFSSCQKDLNEQSLQSEAVSSDATAADNAVETASPVHTAVTYGINSNVSGFMQSVPAKYSQTTKRYPLIVFIHGIGELGSGVTRLNCCGLPHHMANKTFPANFNVGGVNYSFIVISPQFKKRPTAAQVQSVVDFAKRRWRIDDTRVYVTGLSMGGGSTWDWTAVYGQNAAAIVPVCGGTKPSTAMAKNIAAKKLPIWGLYSSADKVVPVQWGRDFFSWIDKDNPSMASRTTLTIWTDASHNTTWARAFDPKTRIGGRNIYEWMLLNRRGSAPASPAPAPTPSGTNKAPIAVAGGDRVLSLATGVNRVLLDGTASKDPDGKITKYLWTKISGPSNTMFNYSTGKTYAAHLVAGTYVFRVTVTDNRGAIAQDDIRITVNKTGSSSAAPKPSQPSTSTNQAPIARAGSDRTIYLSSGVNRVLLDATASYDPDGKIANYQWSFVSGKGYTLSYYAPGKSYAARLTKGTFVFRVKVTDNKGRIATDDVIINVK